MAKRPFHLLELLLTLFLLTTSSIGYLADQRLTAQQLLTATGNMQRLLQEFQLYALACRSPIDLHLQQQGNSWICQAHSEEAAYAIPRAAQRIAVHTTLHVNDAPPGQQLHLIIDGEGSIWQSTASGLQTVTSLSFRQRQQQLYLSLRAPLAPRICRRQQWLAENSSPPVAIHQPPLPAGK